MTTCTAPGCTCQLNILKFPQPQCPRHTSDEQRALLADLDRRGRGIGIRDGGWPYGPNIDIRADPLPAHPATVACFRTLPSSELAATSNTVPAGYQAAPTRLLGG